MTDKQAITYKDALNAIQFYLKENQDLAWSWHCNIAMTAVDAGAPHLEANKRTADFMRRAFGVDVTDFKEYKAIMQIYETLNAAPTPPNTITITVDEYERLKAVYSKLIKLAAQMAMKQNMPDVEHVEYSVNIPKKSWRSIRKMCTKSTQQCNDWSYELRKIADEAIDKARSEL
jgi:hypothetical protein